MKASLKVMDAVASNVAIAPAASCGKRENPLAARDWMFQRYVRATRVHRVSLWLEKNVRAMSGSPANFWPVWFQRLEILIEMRTMRELMAKKRG